MERVLISVLIMAGTTYLLRMLPIAIFKKKIKNQFIKSFLAYIPYAVLSAMTFPAILYSTDNIYSATVGMVVALITAFLNKSLINVAVSACISAFCADLLIRFII